MGEYPLPVCSVCSVKSVGASLRLRGRSLLLRRNSHRIHRIHRNLLLRRNSHRFHGFTQKFIAEKRLPQNSQNSQKFIVEKKLPQISRIYTDASKLFCEFHEFCGSKYLCGSVQSVGEYPLPVCSVCSVKSVGASLRLRGRSLLLKRKLPRNSRNTQKFIAQKKTPTDFTDLHRCKQIVL